MSMSVSTSVVKGRMTFTRILLAVFTCGLSLLWVGVRKKQVVVTTTT